MTMTCAGAAALGFGLGWQGAIPGAICGFAAAAIYLWIRQGVEGLDIRRMLPPWMRG